MVLGFDGVDFNLTRQFMDQGLLPNLAKLAESGSFTGLEPANPSMSPVSWSSFAVGGDPGQHGVYDFLTRTREGQTYIPSPEAFVGLVEPRFFGGIPYRLPKVINKRGGTAFWDTAAANGIKTALVLVPVTFAPPELPNGVVISGLGVPDLCGTQATYFFLTTDEQEASGNTEFGGKVTQLVAEQGTYKATLEGPLSPVWKQKRGALEDRLAAFSGQEEGEGSEPGEDQVRLQKELEDFRAHREYLTMPFEATPLADGSGASIVIDGQGQTVQTGKWSDWYRVDFEVTPLISARGICKVLLHSVSPEVRIYVAPIEIDPTKPLLPICHPASYSRLMAKKIGLFKTRGWESDTAGLKEGYLGEQQFLDNTFETMDSHTRMALEVLDEDDWGLYVAVISETDRISHMMWRFIDPKHPLYDPHLAAQFGDSIQKSYQKMDDLVGEFLGRMDDRTDLYVVSDHGFQSFRNGVNLNTWLSQNGPGGDSSRPFLNLRVPVTREYSLNDVFGGNSDFFTTEVTDPVTGEKRKEYYVDWSQTQAFAIGLASVYINLKGRETFGVVPRSRYEAVCDEIIKGLESLVDPETGERVVHKVYRGTDIFHGPYAKVDNVAFPDLVVGFKEGYRVGWQSTLGGISKDVISPNREKWSGDHCGVDPSLTTGILFSNRKIDDRVRPTIFDMAPTILSRLGTPFEEMQGRVLESPEEKLVP